MGFGRLSFTTETASACTTEVMQAVAVPKPHITPRMSGQVKGEKKKKYVYLT